MSESVKDTRGLFGKFTVTRTDGTDAQGGKHDGCEYFVLDLTHDPFARAAILAYAAKCAVTHPALADDLVSKANAMGERITDAHFAGMTEEQRARSERFAHHDPERR